MFEKFIKIVALALLFSDVLCVGFISTMFVVIGADYMKLKIYETVGFSCLTAIAFLFPLNMIAKILWKEMK